MEVDRRFIGNIGAMVAWQAANYAAPLLTFPYLARVLTPAGFGSLGFGLAIIAFLIVLVEWGFNFSASKAVARSAHLPAEVGHIFVHTMAVKLGLAAVSLLMILGVSCLVAPGNPLGLVLLGGWLLVLGAALNVQWCLQGLEQLGSFATASILGKFAVVPLTMLLVRAPDDAWIAAALQGAGVIVGSLGSLFFLAKTRRLKLAKVSLKGCLTQLRDGTPTFVSTACHSIYSTSPAIALGALGLPAAVGTYSACDRIRVAAQGVITPISQAAYPRSSRLFKESEIAGLSFVRKVLFFQGAAGASASLLIFAFAPQLVGIVLGPAYVGAEHTLRIICWIPCIVAASNVLSIQTMLPLGLNQSFSRLMLLATALNIALLLPSAAIGGAPGAALAALATETVILVGSACILHRNQVRFFSRKFGRATPP
jgi:O-antigen/teichoic acid export membrane protein